MMLNVIVAGFVIFLVGILVGLLVGWLIYDATKPKVHEMLEHAAQGVLYYNGIDDTYLALDAEPTPEQAIVILKLARK